MAKSLSHGLLANQQKIIEAASGPMVRKFILMNSRLVTPQSQERKLFETTRHGAVMAFSHILHLAILGCYGIFEDMIRLSFDNSRYFFLDKAVKF